MYKNISAAASADLSVKLVYSGRLSIVQLITAAASHVVCGSQSSVVGWVGQIRTQLISLELSIDK